MHATLSTCACVLLVGGRERQGVWDSAGLAAGSAARAVVEGDRGAPNWLAKLELVKRLLVDSGAACGGRAEGRGGAWWTGRWRAVCVEYVCVLQ